MNIQSRWIPQGSRKVTIKGGDAVIYLSETNGVPYALAYYGKSRKPAWHHRFRTEEARAKFISEQVSARLSTVAYKQERKAKRLAFVHTLKVGDVLKSSWGYDQTNTDYYQVIKVIGKSVELCEIAQERIETGFMSGQCIPVPGKFIGKPLRKLVQQGNSIKIASYAYAYPVECKTIAGVKLYGSSYWSSYA